MSATRLILFLALLAVAACAPAAPTGPPSKPTTVAQPTAAPPAKPAEKAAPTSPASTGSTTAPAAQPPAKPAADAAFQKDWNDLAARAKTEGELVVIAAAGSAAAERKVYEHFGQKFGIKVVLSGGGAEIVDRLLGERAQGLSLVDAHSLSSSGVARLLEGGELMAPLRPEIIHPEVLDRATGWRSKDWPWADPQEKFITHYGVNAQFNTPRLYFNTQNVPPAEVDRLRSWNDLLQSNYRIVIMDPSEGEAAGADRTHTWMNSQLGRDFLARLLRRPNLTIMPAGASRPLIDGMARGEWDFATFPGPAEIGLTELKGIGLPVDEFPHTFSEGSTARTFGSLAVMANPPHPNAAKLFVNWYLSREGGTAFNELMEPLGGRAHLRSDVPKGNTPDNVWATLQSSTVVVRSGDYFVADEESRKWFQETLKELGIRP